MRQEIVDLGEYKITIDHGDNGYLNVLVEDELGYEVGQLEVEDDVEGDTEEDSSEEGE